MLLKRIRCQTTEQLRPLFFESQKSWGELKDLDGFLIQAGGWDINDPHSADLLGFWKDVASYDKFMKNDHDDLVQRIGQKQTYLQCETALFCSKTINGCREDDTLKQVLDSKRIGIVTYSVGSDESLVDVSGLEQKLSNAGLQVVMEGFELYGKEESRRCIRIYLQNDEWNSFTENQLNQGDLFRQNRVGLSMVEIEESWNVLSSSFQP